MIKGRLTTFIAVLLVLVSVFSLNFVNADSNTNNINQPESVISPNYVLYCPNNADGAGKHYDTSSMPVKAKYDGILYPTCAEWKCSCGAKMVYIQDLGDYYFYPKTDATVKTGGVFPNTYQYYDVTNLHYGTPIDWHTAW